MNIQCDLKTLECCDIKTQKWTFEGNRVFAKCVKVYDGDTATFAFAPFTGSQPCLFSCRCLGYNSAEIKTKDIKEKQKAIESRDYLAKLILNKIVTLQLGKFDKYGRVLVHIYINNRCVNDEMVRLGYGKPYDGTGVKNF
jgi:endonuclease YncB( thermonuclease family)